MLIHSISIITFVLFGSQPQAQASGQAPLVPDFCKDPVALVCSGAHAADVRKGRIQSIESQIREEALKKVIATNHLTQIQGIEDLASLKPARYRAQIMKNLGAEMRDGLTRYLKANGVEQGVLFKEIQQAALYLVENSPHLSANAKERFKDILTQVRFVSMADAAADSENTTLDIRLINKGCAKDHFVDNAFADQRKHGDRVIILCPGMLIAAVEFSKAEGLPRSIALAPVIATLGHEISHHVDYRDFPQEYGFLIDALKPFNSELVKGTLEEHMSEISADFWGNETMALYLQEIPDAAMRAKILRGSMNDLCGTHDEGIHPTGEYRIRRVAALTYCQK